MTPLKRFALDQDILLRRAGPDDRPAIDAMHFLSVQGLGATDYTPAQIELFLGHLGTWDPTLIDDGTYYVLEHAGRIVGSGGWSRRLPHADMPVESEGDGVEKVQPFSLSPHSAKIRSIFVHPKYARLGLGARLVRHAEAEALAAGHHLFELWSTLTGLPLYRKLGYQEIAPITIPCGTGAGLRAIHMAKLVPALAGGAHAA